MELRLSRGGLSLLLWQANKRKTVTAPSRLGSSRVSRRSASAPACTSATPPSADCITWLRRSSTTRLTRRWPATATRSSSSLLSDNRDLGRGQRPRHPRRHPSRLKNARRSRSCTPCCTPAASSTHDVYKVSGGLHGVGASVVNALSEEFEVEVRRDGKLYYQRYERGTPKTKVEERGATKLTGTKTTFSPDPKIFPEIKFKYETIARYLRDMTYLNTGLKIRIKDERNGKAEEYHYDGGIAEFVESLTARQRSARDVIFFQGVREGVDIEVALQWTERDPRGDIHLRQQHPHRRGRHPSVGTQVRAHPHHQFLRDRKIIWSRTRKCGWRARTSARAWSRSSASSCPSRSSRARPRPSSATPRSTGWSRRWSTRSSTGSSKKTPTRRQADHRHARSRPPPPARPRARPRTWSGARARWIRARCPASSPTARSATPRAARSVHRRGRLGRRLGQAGPRPHAPGHPAAARQDPQRREGADRKDALHAGDAHADHGARDGHRRTRRT